MHRLSDTLVSSLAIALTLGLAGCASTQPQPVAEPSSNVPPAAALTSADLHGFWAEYWAPEGKAETQRYVFLDDGRFGWLAPLRDAPRQDPLQRSGHFAIEGDQLVLQVDRERFSGCTGACKNAGEDRVVEHAEPMRLSVEIGECPPNEEAANLDPSYRCRSIGGRAFWHRSAPDAQDIEPFFN